MSVVNLTSDQTYSTLSDAITASSANDVIQISAGTYVENFPNITHNLTIESVGGTAYLSNPQPDPPNGRAVLNVPGNLDVNLTISGLDISGAVDDASNPAASGGANGAGILFESGNGALVVENSRIHGNEDGILTGGANADSVNGMTVTITNSEIDNNGVPPTNVRFGYDHDLYIGAVTQFTITGSYVHDALGGHEIKSRALASTIENNVIADGSAPASYEIDLANGGTDIVTGNVIEKGPNSPQEHMVAFGEEGAYAGSSLNFSNNTIISNGSPNLLSVGAIALFNSTKDPVTGQTDPATMANDTFYGAITASRDVNGAPYDTVTGAHYLPLSQAPSYTAATPLCFLAGTRFLTDGGEVEVERLAIGDTAITLGRRPRRIVWIGKGRVLATRGCRSAATPVIVRKGAIDGNVPNSDLRITRAHGLYVDGALIPVEYLVNHRSILWDDRAQEVTLYHVELETHDVLIANGAPAESYRDDGNRWLFQNADTARGLAPREPCAPVLTGGAVVDAAWRRLLDRSGPRPGQVLTGDPDLHLIAGGKRVDALRRQGGGFAFRLPGSGGPMRLVSRAASPAELGLARDPRVLGVGIESLAVIQGRRCRTMQASDPGLVNGFHGFEPEAGVRWTTGDAVLPAWLFSGFSGAVELIVQIAGTTQYPDGDAGLERRAG